MNQATPKQLLHCQAEELTKPDFIEGVLAGQDSSEWESKTYRALMARLLVEQVRSEAVNQKLSGKLNIFTGVVALATVANVIVMVIHICTK